MSRRYSQWDWSAMRYNYFEGPEPADPGGYNQLRGVRQEVPPRNDGGQLGLDLDRVLRPLPPTARFIGVGTQAVGEVVRSTMRREGPAGPRRHVQRRGLAAGEAVIEPLVHQMVAASGGTQTHPGVTVEALDHPPFALAATAGLALGFGLGRAFGSTGRVFAWTAAALLGLVSAGARREAFLRLTGKKK